MSRDTLSSGKKGYRKRRASAKRRKKPKNPEKEQPQKTEITQEDNMHDLGILRGPFLDD